MRLYHILFASVIIMGIVGCDSDGVDLGTSININIDAREPKAPEVEMIEIYNLDYSKRSVSMSAKVVSEGYPKYIEKGFVISSDPFFLDYDILQVTDNNSVNYSMDYSNWHFMPPFYVKPYIKSEMAISYGQDVRVEAEWVAYEMLGLMLHSQSHGPSDWDVLNQICNTSYLGGYSDWRLPTRTELYAIYSMSEKLVNFNGYTYWTSESVDVMHHYALNFTTGLLETRNAEYYGRCVREI